MSYLIQIGAGAGDQDELVDGFTNFVKKKKNNLFFGIVKSLILRKINKAAKKIRYVLYSFKGKKKFKSRNSRPKNFTFKKHSQKRASS